VLGVFLEQRNLGADEHPPCPAPPVIAHLRQPPGHHPRLARASLGMQHEDAHPLAPGPVERFQLRLAAGEAGAVGAQDVETVRGGGGHGWSGL